MPLPVLRRKDLAHALGFQLWTDALTFRQMAKEAPNLHLGSMCVRNAVLSAWTTLEMACCDALGIRELKTDFKRSLDDEFATLAQYYLELVLVTALYRVCWCR